MENEDMFPKAIIEGLLRLSKEVGPEEDPISEWYQEGLSVEEGRRTGQVYTPPSVAYFMARMALTDDVSSILDPACGCGTFLRALVLASKRGRMRGPLSIEGLEPESIPATLAGMNAASVTGKIKRISIKVLVRDFFDHKPSGDKDVVIGNPPYIRHELLLSKGKIRGQGSILSKRTDLYAYFIERAAGFLKEGGRLVFIVPDKWMDVGYGVGLKGFLLENFCLETVLSFDTGVFKKAEVDTVIINLRRCKDPIKRSGTIVEFVHLESASSMEDLLGILRKDNRAKRGKRSNFARVEQDDLDPRARWSHFLRAPSIFKELMASDRIIPLSAIKGVEVSRGVTTNLAAFFFPKDEVIRKMAIPEGFLVPAVRSPKSIPGLVLEKAHGKMILIPERLPKVDEGALRRMVRWGNERIWGRTGNKKVTELASFMGKGDQWFRLHVDAPADIVVPKFVREGRPRFIWNKARAYVSDTFQSVKVGRKKDIELMLGCLNSVLGALSCELIGRVEGRGLLQVLTYELKGVQLLDPRSLDSDDRKGIIEGYRSLLKGEGHGLLDKSVVRATGLCRWRRRLDHLVKAYEGLRRARLARTSTFDGT